MTSPARSLPPTISADQDAVVEQIDIAATPETVWAALADPQQLLQWWGDCGLSHIVSWEQELKVGGALHACWRGPDGADFHLDGKFLVIDPPRCLSYSWCCDWAPPETSAVTWELKPVAGGTRVQITHSGLRGYPEAIQSYGGGWPGVLRGLRDCVLQAASRNPAK